MLDILLIITIIMCVVTNLLYAGILIKQIPDVQNKASKIVTIGLIVTLLVMTSYIVFMPFWMKLI